MVYTVTTVTPTLPTFVMYPLLSLSIISNADFSSSSDLDRACSPAVT